MTHSVEVRRTIETPAQDLWATISQMDQVEAWYHEFISAYEVLDPDAAQPKGKCTMANCGTLKERILLRNETTRTFIDSIDSHSLPAKYVVGSLRVGDLIDRRSAVNWGANIVLGETIAPHITEMVTSIYAKGLEGLEMYHASK